MFLYSVALLVFTVKECLGSDDIVKCLKVPNEKFQIVCPRGHVIYDPSVLTGISQTGSCERAPGDCIGQSEYIRHQVAKCYWRNKCEIKLCRKDKIKCGKSFAGKTDHIHYVLIRQAHCIPKDLILDVCAETRRFRKFDFSVGVIRSDRRFPRPVMKDIHRTCNFTIPIPQSHTLVATGVWDSESSPHPPSVKVYEIGTRPGNSTRNVTDIFDKAVISGNTAKAIEITAKLGPRKRLRTGFIIPFATYRTKTLEDLKRWPMGSRDVLKSLDWIFEVKSVIRQCIGSGPGEVTLQCNKNDVIYSAELSVSGYTRAGPRCMFGRFPCGGLSPDILVQKNTCYWQNSCKVTWSGERRILVSTKRSCIGYVASNLGISGIQCVQKKNVFDLCSNITDMISTSWGVIRSHPNYPWYFDTNFTDCKRIIKIGKGYSLLIIVQDMNLDPDGRDKFSVRHVTREGRREAMDAKLAKEGAHLTLIGGRVVIRFKPFPASKAGRGCILVFRRKKISELDRYTQKDQTMITGDEVLNDAAGGMTYRLTHRRLCSGKKKERRRGRSCHARVWTDFFTRID